MAQEPARPSRPRLSQHTLKSVERPTNKAPEACKQPARGLHITMCTPQLLQPGGRPRTACDYSKQSGAAALPACRDALRLARCLRPAGMHGLQHGLLTAPDGSGALQSRVELTAVLSLTLGSTGRPSSCCVRCSCCLLPAPWCSAGQPEMRACPSQPASIGCPALPCPALPALAPAGQSRL